MTDALQEKNEKKTFSGQESNQNDDEETPVPIVLTENSEEEAPPPKDNNDTIDSLKTPFVSEEKDQEDSSGPKQPPKPSQYEKESGNSANVLLSASTEEGTLSLEAGDNNTTNSPKDLSVAEAKDQDELSELERSAQLPEFEESAENPADVLLSAGTEDEAPPLDDPLGSTLDDLESFHFADHHLYDEPQDDNERQLHNEMDSSHPSGDADASIVALASENNDDATSNWWERFSGSRFLMTGVFAPILIVLFVVIPGMMLIALLVGVCLVPTFLMLCFACCMYCIAPETTGAFFFGTNPYSDNGLHHRWIPDWAVDSSEDEDERPKTREEIESEMIILRVLSSTQTDDKSMGEETLETMETGIAAKLGGANTEKGGPTTGEVGVVALDALLVTTCDICLLDYEPGDLITRSRNSECNHVFHKECMLDWMEKKPTCPCCRKYYLAPAKSDKDGNDDFFAIDEEQQSR